MFDTVIEIAEIKIRIRSDMPLFVEKRVEPFLASQPFGNKSTARDTLFIKEIANEEDCLVTIKSRTLSELEKQIEDYNKEYGEYYRDEHTVLYVKDNKYISCHTMIRKGKKSFLICEEKKNEYLIYADENFSEMFETEGKYIQYIPLEKILIRHNAFYLHSSLITLKSDVTTKIKEKANVLNSKEENLKEDERLSEQIEEKAYIFSGPSGIGKSTQAELWKKHAGAEILNGDRSIIRKNTDGEFFAYGSPFAGSSKIYKNKKGKLSGVFFLQQGKHNSAERQNTKESFIKLYSQSMIAGLTKEEMQVATGLLAEIASNVTVYEYTCTKTPDAVEYLKENGLIS